MGSRRGQAAVAGAADTGGAGVAPAHPGAIVAASRMVHRVLVIGPSMGEWQRAEDAGAHRGSHLSCPAGQPGGHRTMAATGGTLGSPAVVMMAGVAAVG